MSTDTIPDTMLACQIIEVNPPSPSTTPPLY